MCNTIYKVHVLEFNIDMKLSYVHFNTGMFTISRKAFCFQDFLFNILEKFTTVYPIRMNRMKFINWLS